MVVDAAAVLRSGNRSRDLALMFGALCHDLGKPSTTVLKDGRWISHAHDVAGVGPAGIFMDQVCAGQTLKYQTQKLVRWHLSPLSLLKQEASPAAFRRLARDLDKVGLTLEDLYALALADHQGRGMNEHTQASVDQLPLFKEKALTYGVFESPPQDAVTGGMLMARGVVPGPELGQLLRACQDAQDETPEASPACIMDRVLGK
jgi:tRNA nucleotidyltransferase (CCA-adding enzyme)